MKCIRLFSLGAALALTVALLTGCAGSSSSSSAASSDPASTAPASVDTAAAQDLDALFDTVLAANPISNPFTIADMNIEYDFLLSKEDIVAYKGVKSNDNGDAGLVLVIQTAAGRAQSVCEALESYRDDQVAYYGNYAEFAQAQENVRNAALSAHGDLVVMAIASSECPDQAALSTAVSAAAAS